MKVYVIWVSSGTRSSIAGVSSSRAKAVIKAKGIAGDKFHRLRTQRDGTIEINLDGWNYIFLVPAILDGAILEFDHKYYGLESIVENAILKP